MVCSDGSGVIHHQGSSDRVDPGMACLLPPQSPNHFQITESRQWTYAFIRYSEPPGVVPVTNVHTPLVGAYNARPLVQAIWGLHAEASGNALAAALHLWVELIHGYVVQFAQPKNQDARVSRAWERIGNHLSHPWTLNEIAAASSMSTEHFRRLCRRSIRCSPMKHLAQLRMQRASDLLSTSELTIEAIAFEVGYSFASTFSNTFKKWSGQRPSDFRLASRIPYENGPKKNL